jgi:hypothetical protein
MAKAILQNSRTEVETELGKDRKVVMQHSNRSQTREPYLIHDFS